MLPTAGVSARSPAPPRSRRGGASHRPHDTEDGQPRYTSASYDSVELIGHPCLGQWVRGSYLARPGCAVKTEDVSAVIPTPNRHTSLERTLGALAREIGDLPEDDTRRLAIARRAQQAAVSKDADWTCARFEELYAEVAGNAGHT